MSNNKQYKLRELRIEKTNRFDNTTEPYKGKVSFVNEEYEDFTMKLPPDIATKILHMIAPQVATAATSLGFEMLKSLGLIDENGKRLPQAGGYQENDLV